jgi:enoyl-[acyl-carrier protein] reductase II
MKQLTPVRLIKNQFYNQVQEAENRCASKEEMATLLGRARAKKGMFEGDLDAGELEIGQVATLLNDILPVSTIIEQVKKEFSECLADPLKNT